MILVAFAAWLVASGGDGMPTVQAKWLGDDYAIEGTFSLAAPATSVFAVLSDYDHLPAFVSSLESSHIVQQSHDRKVVEQEGRGKVWFIKREIHVRLEIKEIANRSIFFRDTAERDFRRFSGSWTISESNGTTSVTYRLRVSPRGNLPGMLEAFFKSDAEHLLNEVRSEIIRREHSHSSLSTSSLSTSSPSTSSPSTKVNP